MWCTPSILPGSPAIGATLIARIPYLVVRLVPSQLNCDPMDPLSLGPVTLTSGHDCYLYVQVVV